VTNRHQPLVLVVDDEEPIRQIERRILESCGYRVIEAPGGLEGVGMIVANGVMAAVAARNASRLSSQR